MSKKSLELNNSKIPLVGFGTYLISNDAAESVVLDAFKVGYRHIDTAQGYFNEAGIGNAIGKAISSGNLKREDLYITTKVWPGNEEWGEDPKGYDESIAAFKESLAKLQLDYIDLYLIHAPFANNHRIEQWKALVHLQETGKVKDIGVCNYNIDHLEEIKTEGLLPPIINQIELHPWSQKTSLMKYMGENSIHAMAYSSLVPLSTWREKPGQESSKTNDMKAEGENKESPFKIVSQKHGVSEAQVLLKWAVQQNIPVIPKSVNPERMRQNLELFSFQLDSDDMDLFKSLDKGSGVAWVSGDPSNFMK